MLVPSSNRRKLFRDSVSFCLFDIKLILSTSTTIIGKKIKEEETVPPQVGFFVWGSFFSEVSAWNSKDVADFGELVRPLMIRQF